MQVANLCLLPLEYHLWPNVRSGFARCPSGFRLLDLLNYVGEAHPNVMGDFFEYVDSTDAGPDIPSADTQWEYVRKSAIEMVAVAKEDLGRGVGAGQGQRGYPYRQKQPVMVRIELRHHSLIGMVHCPEGHGIRHILGLPQMFFPVTDVTISHEYGLYGSRPFVAVNKGHVISVRQAPSFRD
jgi:hypothetical protein